jgi:hypothetical protein
MSGSGTPFGYKFTVALHESRCGNGGGGHGEERLLSQVSTNDLILTNDITTGNYSKGLFLNERLEARNDWRDSLPVLQDLYDSLQFSPVAEINAIQQSLSDSLPDSTIVGIITNQVANLNTSISFEATLAQLFPLLAKVDSGGIAALNSADQQLIDQIAGLCALEYGNAVYLARALFARINHQAFSATNTCAIGNNRISDDTNSTDDKKYVIKDHCVVFNNKLSQGSYIIVFDTDGRKIVEKGSVQDNRFSLEDFGAGVYLFVSIPDQVGGYFINVK